MTTPAPRYDGRPAPAGRPSLRAVAAETNPILEHAAVMQKLERTLDQLFELAPDEPPPPGGSPPSTRDSTALGPTWSGLTYVGPSRRTNRTTTHRRSPGRGHPVVPPRVRDVLLEN